VLKELQVDPACGLAEAEAVARRWEYGANVLAEAPRPGIWFFLGKQFTDFMVLVLLGAAVVSFLCGEYLDAGVILAIVFLNALLGFFQEYRAERSLQALSRLHAPQARVLREGTERIIPARDVVPGDILLLEAGDLVPADARLLEAISLAAEESVLTGESVPVSKRADPVSGAVAAVDRHNMLFMGTAIARGRGRAVVTSTGMATEMGAIAGMIAAAHLKQTPLQARLQQLGKYLVDACLLIVVVVSVVGIYQGVPPYRMFLSGVSLAVAAIPEGLPAIVTAGLALGVQRLARVQAIVRQLPAVETLGCTTVICTDKTGTLTRNEMTVRMIVTAQDQFHVSGEGYNAKGVFSRGGVRVDPGREKALREFLTAAALCCNARLVEQRPARPRRGRRGLFRRGQWQVLGDPTEGALLVAARKAGLFHTGPQRVAEKPFDAANRRMSVVVWDNRHGYQLITKGAPETVLALCSHYRFNGGQRPLTGEARQRFMVWQDEMAQDAFRVLAVAIKDLQSPPGDGLADVEGDLVLLGLVGMSDPPRPEVPKAVQECQRAGIRVVMVTGDGAHTAAAIGRQIGLNEQGGVLTGKDIDQLSDQDLAIALQSCQVFARVEPHHKLRIVRLLKEQGEVVAMTGDGVNDAPALKESHIGVAMGINGTDVSREAAAIILADDNFATIVAAVREGRGVVDNIRKFIRYLLACNTGEVLVMFCAAAAGWPLPVLPIQILLVNLVTDGLPAMALGVDPLEAEVMHRPPRPPGEGIFARRLGRKILGRGLIIAFGTLLVFWSGLWFSNDLATARTMALATLVLSQLTHAFDCRSEESSILELGLGHNPFLLAAVACSLGFLIAVVHWPVLQLPFRTVALSAWEWLLVGGVSLSGSLLVEMRRALLYSGSWTGKERK
jgi:Ca2+-transporting ATPase